MCMQNLTHRLEIIFLNGLKPYLHEYGRVPMFVFNTS